MAFDWPSLSMQNHPNTTRPRHKGPLLDLSAGLLALAGLLGMVATGVVTVTGRFDHLNPAAELVVAVGLGAMTMMAFAPWRFLLGGSRQRREIRRLTEQLSSTGRREPLRALLRDGDDEIARLCRAVHDRLTEAAAHRVAAGHLRRTMDDSIRRETGRATGRLRKEVHTDVLTGIGNRRALEEHLGRMFDEARQQGEPLAALVIDVDRFKPINDVLGHAVGDECLAFLGGVLGGSLRGHDRAFRTGGDEFVVLMPGATADIGVKVGTRLGTLYRQMAWTHTNVPQPSLSIGVASVRPGQIDDPQELIRRADEAMYAAKREGRARITSYRDLRGAA